MEGESSEVGRGHTLTQLFLPFPPPPHPPQAPTRPHATHAGASAGAGAGVGGGTTHTSSLSSLDKVEVRRRLLEGGPAFSCATLLFAGAFSPLPFFFLLKFLVHTSISHPTWIGNMGRTR